jgi:alkanesulfonate monooxygenase SsuD/methylene tetrahydromethanopterin reductase-like flavin-dependent oxidoreductase (luciferase family)
VSDLADMAERGRLRLYAWQDPYDVRWGTSVVVAVAASEDDARAKARRARLSPFGMEPDKGQVMPLDAELDGPPDWVSDDLTVCLEWSE